MLFVLSPAKSLDFETPSVAAVTATEPQFLAHSARLIDVLQRQRASKVAQLMNLSPALAALNVDRYKAWRADPEATSARPAVFAFDGDVYQGLQARTWPTADVLWAQDHLAILSGLYGALRPLDLLQPYRLEMGTRLRTRRGSTLYEFWGGTLTEHLNRLAAADASPVVVNLASQEYFKAIDRTALKPRVIDCVFQDWSGGQYKIVSFHAKRARGLMARHAVLRRVGTPDGLRDFDLEGYSYAPDVSTDDRFVFRRASTIPLAAVG